MIINTEHDYKTRFTRKCISEAIISLMETTGFEKLHISDIVRKAGVARMTFYKHYQNPKAALIDYLHMIISEFIEASPDNQNRDVYRSYEHILYSLKFFDQYRDFFLMINRNGLYGILMDGVNEFMAEYIQTNDKMSVYELYSYAGGLLNTFLMWEERGAKDPAEDVAAKIYELYGKK